MPEHKHEHPDELLQRAIAATRHLPIPAGPSPAVMSQTLAALRETASKPQHTILQRITHMPWTTRASALVAVAASVVIMYTVLSNPAGASRAFADVAEALNNVKTATWKTTSVAKLKLPGEKEEKTITTHSNCMFLAPSHERTETIAEGDKISAISIVDGEKDKAITLVPASKTATVINSKNFPKGENPFGRTFRGLQELVANAQSGKAGKVRPLGTKTIDDRSAEGFGIQVGSIDVQVWADAKTLLPVRAEYVSAEPSASTTMTDFRVKVPLDEALFSVNVPADYTIQQTTEIDASKVNELLAGALKLAAESNDGVFPPALRGEHGVIGTIQLGTATLIEKHKGSPEELRRLATDLSTKVAALSAFLAAGPPDAYHYAGKDVKLGTPNRPILWLTGKERGRCMIFYADLTVKDVPADEAPNLPDAENATTSKSVK